MFESLPAHASTNTYTYAGIGSRGTPTSILNTMRRIAAYLETLGYTLNSGGARGADSAFESGAKSKNVFLASHATDATRIIAREIHPYPHLLKPYPLDLMARNTFQIFGKDLNTPVDFVVCYTPDGCEHHNTRTRATGGTGQAIEMASRKNIPVVNLHNKDWQRKLRSLMPVQ